MRTPTIHLNGSGKASLASALETAVINLQTAQDALADCTPNGRDYYPQGDNAIGEAVAEHRARMAKLREVSAELMAIWESIEG